MAEVPKTQPSKRGQRLPVVEILEQAEAPIKATGKTIDFFDDVTKAVTVYAGKQAFRIYQASDGLIGKNSIGTLQGMVKNANARTVFRISHEVGERIEVLAFIAAFAENISKASPEIEGIWLSNDSPARKCVHFTRVAEAIGNRTVVGVVTSGVSTIYEVLKGWCLIGSLTGGRFGEASSQCVKVLDDADFRVKTAGTTIADFAANSNPILNTIDLILH